MTDLGIQIADLLRSIDVEDAELGYTAFSEAMEERFPHASHSDIAKAQKILENDYRTERVEHQASIATVRRMLTLIRKTIPDGIRFGKAVADGTAAEGQGMACYLVELVDWYNPTPVAWMVLFRSAVDMHRKWEPAGPGWYICLDENCPQGTPQSLVESFPTAFPSVMRLLEETVRRGRDHA